MYNSDIPSRAELPSTAQLIKSTVIAFVTAVVLLVTIVLPAEYAVDPTGIGRALKLTEMGEIKKQLAEEARRDRQQDAPSPQSSLFSRIMAEMVIGKAYAQEPVRMAQTQSRTDETIIVLKPSDGVEWKMTMARDAQVQYSWSVEGGVVNYDMHGTPRFGKERSYKNARGVGSDEGTLTAAFDGTHGWFFRNRGDKPVTVTLRTNGAYSDLKKM